MSENRLGREKSPYLLQHKDNPVHWWAWGQDAFEAAKRENKPVFLSVGYSTCYWCHVMEKDSFERDDVAAVLNSSFISIKVDREERPDVDKIYMDAVTAISGHGGWPMSVFLTPQGKPFFGATFFYREQFLKLLASIDESWRTRQADLETASDRIIDHLREVTQSAPSDGKIPTAEIFSDAKKLLDGAFDEKNGGFGPAPKFPHPGAISLLLRISHRNDDSEAENIAVTTLDRMARGGIYDHLGGGFARYATDAAWRVPHFEKMLYDNSQLAIAYLDGLQFTGRPMFRQVVRETLDYLLREMTAPGGGFYSAQDAGEVGKEGEFYIWTANEIDSNLPADERLQFKQLFNITPQGNFEKGTSILSISPEADWDRRTKTPIEQARRKLFELRIKREAPHKDDKILVSWNGLAISAFTRASQVLGDSGYLEAAVNAARLIEQKLLVDGKLLRRFRDEAGIEGMLDDYSFFIQGLIDLYQANFDLHWLDLAQKLQKRQDELFWRESERGYAYTSGADKTLLSQPVSFSDGAEPSPNGVSAFNLLRLYKLTNDRAMEKRGLSIISQALNSRRVHPLEFSTILQALDFHLGPTPEIAVIGIEDYPASEFVKAAAPRYMPNKVVAAGKPAGFDDQSIPALLRGKQLRDGKTTYYICQNHTCREPVTDLNKALEMISLESAPKARTAAPE